MKTKTTPHAFLAIQSGHIFFRVTNENGYDTQGSEPFAVGNTRHHTCMEDARRCILDMLTQRGITSFEIVDYRGE